MSRSAVIDRMEEGQTSKPRTSAQRDGPSNERGHGGGGPLERVTVNLIVRASRALQRLSELTGDTKTDSINRALQIAAYLEEVNADGGEIYVRETKDSELRLLKMF